MAQSRSKKKSRIGEVLLEHGVITSYQLKEALKIQSQKGGQIGSILIEQGAITQDVLLDFLGKQFGVPTANLFQIDIPKNVLSLIPFLTIKERKVLPVDIDDNAITLAMVNPNDVVTIHEIEFMTGRRVRPIIVHSSQFNLALKSIEKRGCEGFSGAEIAVVPKEEEEQRSVKIESMMQFLTSSSASDMLITAGASPAIKIHNTLKRASLPPLTAEQCVLYAKSLMKEQQWEDFLENKEAELMVNFPHIGRFRITVYRQRNSVSMNIRHIFDIVPGFEDLGLPQWLEDCVLKTHGLILVTSPAGHGKTTTLASMVDLINTKRKCNIITLEEPIEYLHKHKNSNVNQREIGIDADSFSAGMRGVFRQSPDVIVIGDLRDNETFEAALHAALTGHLVLATVQSLNTTFAIDSLVNRFVPHMQSQIRGLLADSLLLIFAQRLLPLKGSEKRVLAYEKLTNTYRVKNFIRENRVHQIRVQLQTDSGDFSTLDSSLAKLVSSDKVSLEDAMAFAENPELVRARGK